VGNERGTEMGLGAEANKIWKQNEEGNDTMTRIIATGDKVCREIQDICN
jgi:hypothetical protein